MSYDVIKEVSKRYDVIDEIQKFNPYHDKFGRFSSAGIANTFTIRTKDPSKQHWADMAMAREKDKYNKTVRVGEAENALKSMLKHGAVVKLEGIDPEAADEVVASVRKVMERYPITKDALEGITTDDTSVGTFKTNPNAMAAHDSATKMIYLNAKYFGDKATLDKTYDECVEKKFHPEGTKSDSVITHEIGHALDYHVSAEALGMRAVWGGDSISARKWNNDIAAGQRKGEPMSNFSIRDGLSMYASKNNAEYFAEGFAEGIHSPTPRKTATSIMKHLDTYVNKATNNPKGGKW